MINAYIVTFGNTINSAFLLSRLISLIHPFTRETRHIFLWVDNLIPGTTAHTGGGPFETRSHDVIAHAIFKLSKDGRVNQLINAFVKKHLCAEMHNLYQNNIKPLYSPG